MQMTNKEINLAQLAFAVGQACDNHDMSRQNVEALVDCANKFTEWEKKSVLSLPNGWGGYIANGGDDYESIIYKQAEEFVNEQLG